MDNATENKNVVHITKASSQNVPVSTKQCIEICGYLRYKITNEAKRFLESVIAHKAAVPFKKFNKNVGHKPGMAAGRFPQKAAREMLRLVKSVESNAQFKGLNNESLKITKILANRAPNPSTGNRHHHGTKRTHLEIEVMEKSQKPKIEKKPENKKENKREVKMTKNSSAPESKSTHQPEKGEQK